MNNDTTLKQAYLHVYYGITCPFRLGIHTSFYIEDDPYEWSYGINSLPQTTHNIVYHGVVYENPFQFTYGDWGFWKAIPIGYTDCGLGGSIDSKETTEEAREKIKDIVGRISFSDNGYSFIDNNCWRFCYEMARIKTKKNLQQGFIESMNDEWHNWFPGFTQTSINILQFLSNIFHN